jgi:hypothetical protein
VRQVCHLPELYRDARSTKNKILNWVYYTFGYQCANRRQQHAHRVVGQRRDVRNWRDTNICVAYLRHTEYRFQILLKETNLKHNAGLYQILCSNQIYIVLATATIVQTVFLFVNIKTATHLTDEGRILLRFSWLAVMYTTALTSAHEYVVAYTIMSEGRTNSLHHDASGTSATGWLPPPSSRLSGANRDCLEILASCRMPLQRLGQSCSTLVSTLANICSAYGQRAIRYTDWILTKFRYSYAYNFNCVFFLNLICNKIYWW